MSDLSPDSVLATLKTIIDPIRKIDVVTLGLVQGLNVKNGHVSFALEVQASEGATSEPLRQACEKAVLALPGARSVTAVLTAHKQPAAAPKPPERQGPKGVKAVIAVASGKGGVGKSTVAVNLAVALQRLGHATGLLDADIYGPSVPRMLGLSGKPTSKDGKILQPMQAWGLKAMSIGSLISDDQPMIWRGPMVMTALTQLIYDVEWAPLDILVVDMPHHRFNTPGHRPHRCAQGPGDVPAHPCAGSGHCRKHEHLFLSELRPRIPHLRPWRRAGNRSHNRL
jgi:ATP-binding protein involved in chromosome partitioning